jgi:23S rRNA pseudouridine1911/1915/1917 synthase
MERRSNLRDLSQIVEQVEFEVNREQTGQRLDAYLSWRLPWRSKTAIQAWIIEARVQIVNRGAVKKSTRLQDGDIIRIAVPPPRVEVRHEELAAQLIVIYEDEDLVVLNKAPGLVVHPVGQIRYNTLIQALHWHYRHGPGREAARRANLPVVPKICHRLDKETSGIIIIAKNDPARRQVQDIFENRELDKSYETIVWGSPGFESQRIDAPLALDPESGHGMKMAVKPHGMPSRSEAFVLRRFAELEPRAHLRVKIETGRQHQIRVHCAHLGHPVLCDSLYGRGEGAIIDAQGRVVIDRQALHARAMRIPHPMRSEELHFEAALPRDIETTIALFASGQPWSTRPWTAEKSTPEDECSSEFAVDELPRVESLLQDGIDS